jgi:YcaO-like protein with predicted kinase domain
MSLPTASINKLTVESDHQPLLINKTRHIHTKQTLKKLLFLRNILGITRLSDITELDCIGIPVVSAIRPRVNDAQITATQGKGLNVQSAIVSALMEAVERYSAANFSASVSFSIDDITSLQGTCLAPEHIGGAVIELNQKIDWILGKNLADDSEVFLPAADILFPYYSAAKNFRPMVPSTTGLAAGNTVVEALLSSIFEVIERDAVSQFLKNAHAAIVDLASITDHTNKNLIKLFQDANLDIVIFDLSHFSPLHVFYVSIMSPDGIGLAISCAGQGCHFFPEIALRRALTEAAQSRAVAIQGSREDLIRHASDWQGTIDEIKNLREAMKNAALSFGGIIPMLYFETNTMSIAQLICTTLQKLTAANYGKIFYTNLTHPLIKIPVVHTIIPGMVDNIVDPIRKRAPYSG